MNIRRIIITLVQLCVLAVAAWGLYLLTNISGSHGEQEQEVEPEVAVHFGTITLSTMRRYLTAYGQVVPQPSAPGKAAAEAHLSAATPSIIAEVNCIQGQHVDKGQLLFSLDSRTADAAVDSANKLLASARQTYDRLEKSSAQSDLGLQLITAKIARDQAQANLDAANARLASLKILSPISGVVTNLRARPGEISDPAISSVDLVDLDRLVIDANVPPAELPLVHAGQSAEIFQDIAAATRPSAGPSTMPSINQSTTPSTLPSNPTAAVVLIDPAIDPITGMGTVDVSIPSGVRLMPGQFIAVKIVIEEHRDCLTVPAGAIVKDVDGSTQVNLVKADVAIPVPVQVGFRDGDNVEISGKGLHADQTIVATGAYAIVKSAKVHELDQDQD